MAQFARVLEKIFYQVGSTEVGFPNFGKSDKPMKGLKSLKRYRQHVGTRRGINKILHVFLQRSKIALKCRFPQFGGKSAKGHEEPRKFAYASIDADLCYCRIILFRLDEQKVRHGPMRPVIGETLDDPEVALAQSAIQQVVGIE